MTVALLGPSVVCASLCDLQLWSYLCVNLVVNEVDVVYVDTIPTATSIANPGCLCFVFYILNIGVIEYFASDAYAGGERLTSVRAIITYVLTRCS